MDVLTPKDHGEEVAVFRHSLIGAIAIRSLTHGERAALLRSASEQRVRPPGCDITRCYSVPTLERWLPGARVGYRSLTETSSYFGQSYGHCYRYVPFATGLFSAFVTRPVITAPRISFRSML